MATSVTTDPLHSSSDPGSHWTRANLAEAIPGVPTPLGWTIWADAGERNMRRFFRAVGVLAQKDTGVPTREEDRVISIFFGRASLRVDFLADMGDRLLGTSGTAVVRQLFGTVPEGFVSRAQPRYYPVMAARMPGVMRTATRRARAARQESEAWWRNEIRTMAGADVAEAQRRFLAAAERFEHDLYTNILVLSAVVQPIFDQLTRLVDAAGGVGANLMGGYGEHAEAALVEDLWACSRGRLEFDEFLAQHGYHGGLELSDAVWRDDPAPVREMLEGYRQRGDEANPAAVEADRMAARRAAERELLAALPAHRRPAGRAIMALAARYVPLRGVGKAAYTRTFDVARSAARRLGTGLADAGILSDPDDVFYLTRDEVAAGDWSGAGERITARRERRAAYQHLDYAVHWTGLPEPHEIAPPAGVRTDGAVRTLTGVAASPGVIEGRVHVMTTPGADAIGEGDILVAHVTDPSWASVLFLAGGLVTDIGGLLSHAAVVARELGVPCVVGAVGATEVLRTGDLCRLDGTTGRIEILKREGN